MNSFVGAFHDAVILYALALNETLANNRSITNGTEITHRMWNRTFEGELFQAITWRGTFQAISDISMLWSPAWLTKNIEGLVIFHAIYMIKKPIMHKINIKR